MSRKISNNSGQTHFLKVPVPSASTGTLYRASLQLPNGKSIVVSDADFAGMSLPPTLTVTFVADDTPDTTEEIQLMLEVIKDSSGTMAVFVENRSLHDESGDMTVTWRNTQLISPNDGTTLNWDDSTLYGSTVEVVADWKHGFRSVSGPTANRLDNFPALGVGDKGVQYYDTDLNLPIWWNGSSWIDAAGNLV